ncbi:hypothetical protein HPP92_002844 [Vanilla planifolia]|uniref:Uncharacterized protein n=1 Tax=Vanilla planifolia TaxID=51239 RepID=A0A835S697_VANPL|nr:hypothetical protein HPP92_002844 [Vanilla planifolia]
MAGGNASEGGEFEAEKVGDFLVGNGARRRGRRNGLSKKAKKKKIPQRGLGIAALEKLREEEQQKEWKPFTFPFFPLIRPPLIPLVPLV